MWVYKHQNIAHTSLWHFVTLLLSQWLLLQEGRKTYPLLLTRALKEEDEEEEEELEERKKERKTKENRQQICSGKSNVRLSAQFPSHVQAARFDGLQLVTVPPGRERNRQLYSEKQTPRKDK